MKKINRGVFSRRFLWVAVFLGVWATPSMAVYEYYSISRSVRALGMGGAFYGLSNDESALYYNPAGLSLYKGGMEIMANLRFEGSSSSIKAFNVFLNAAGKNIAQLSSELEQFQGNPVFGSGSLSGYFLHRGIAVGLLVGDAKGNATVLGAGIDTEIDVTAISDSGLFIGAGCEILPGLHLGATLKGMVRFGGRKTYTIVDIAQGSNTGFDINTIGGAGAGIDADAGATLELPEFIPGVKQYSSISVNNILATQFTLARLTQGSGTTPQLPRMLSIAHRMTFGGIWRVDKFDVVVDFAEFGVGGQSDPNFGARQGSFWKHLNIGVEMPMFGWMALRTGLHQGNFTAGIGFDAKYFKMDLATYAEENAANPGRMSNRRFALRLAAGLGFAPPAVERKAEGETRAPTAVTQPVSTPAAAAPAAASPAGTGSALPTSSPSTVNKESE